jgi:hypothetical protein
MTKQEEKLTVQAIAQMADCTEEEVRWAVRSEMGKARATKLSKERRKEIATIASHSRTYYKG